MNDFINLESQDDEAGATPLENVVLATVTGIGENGVSIQLDGEDSAGEKEYRVNSAQLFSEGDRVKLFRDSGTYIVEYRLGTPMESYPIPPGGSDGQLLAKNGADDYSLKWATESTTGKIPQGGATGQALIKTGDADYSVGWSTVGFLPSGGESGQFLKKTSNDDFSCEWESGLLAPKSGTKGYVLYKTESGCAWLSPPATIPTSGSEGQLLTKTSSGCKWANAPTELPSSGTTGHVLTKTATGVSWSAAPTELPSGGSAGQVLTKTSSGCSWQSPSSGLPSGGTEGQFLKKTKTGVSWDSVSASSIATGNYTLSLDSSGAIVPKSSTYSLKLGTSTYPFNGCYIGGNAFIAGSSGKLGFFGTTTSSIKKTVLTSGTDGGLSSLISALKAYNLIG